jgi:serine/threonine protein kinase/formylglycine-generating enzyme required for sulfatase activity
MSSINDPLRTTPHSGEPGTVAPPVPDLPSHVGRYELKGLLGEGGFGRVYLAHDDQLQRLVAVKVPHRTVVDTPDAANAYLAEARIAAQLDHPHIVPVYDVGSTPELPCFIVSKYIAGTTLAAKLRHDRPAPTAAAALVAIIAEALHHAHQRGVVHRDVKPGNILLDTANQPFIADFGLALREAELGGALRYAGTPPYMSPEQARGEGHRVDGRSDIFSLGIVFYELLLGRRPFQADSRAELLSEIISLEPRPPRQVDDTLPAELERICLKALSKAASQRYTTARDMADDLRCFLQAAAPPAGAPRPPTHSPHDVQAATTPAPGQVLGSSPVQVVPKGLRSFDSGDTDFFLELLPGPRDRDGLPEGLRFWKSRIEQIDADQTFAVGLLYGPSGCGKSSLVKAGLLPRLSASVRIIYLEATGGTTEARLLKLICKHCPGVPTDGGLVAAVAALRRGTGRGASEKVLIVLDQFEQWLHAWQGQENTELVGALRHCEGGSVQCLLLVRDDFWMATTRFLRQLEVRLVEGENAAVVDLFDRRHARKVLAMFGRAYGALPQRSDDLTAEQGRFLDQAAEDLAQDGKVIPVRLAVFAEMVKGREWSPATLKGIGGMKGVGVTFLDEVFGPQAPQAHRIHQAAARAVLKALLPADGTNIRGAMRSRQDLLEAAGWADYSEDFQQLIQVLERELRLVSPSGLEEISSRTSQEAPAAPGQFYQLTHDYLVPALRAWLTRKQKETLRGRTELRLAELASLWDHKPETRHLPSCLEDVRIRLFTRRRDWSPAEGRMMRASGRYHALWGLVLVAVLALVGWALSERASWSWARQLQDRLLTADMEEVPGLIDVLGHERFRAQPLLERALSAPENQQPSKQLRLRLALVQWCPDQAGHLGERLFDVAPQEFVVVRGVLAQYRDVLAPKLWAELASPRSDPDHRFRAACALTEYAPGDARWADESKFVVQRLLVTHPAHQPFWADALRAARNQVLPALASSQADCSCSETQRTAITELYRRIANGAPAGLGPLVEELDRTAVRNDQEKEVHWARRRTNVAAALVALGRPEKVWPLLIHTPSPTVRSYLIERLGTAGVDPRALMDRLAREPDVSARRALILALGGLPPGSLPSANITLLEKSENDPDPGAHAAAGWALRQWGWAAGVQDVDKKLAVGRVVGDRQWYVSKTGQTFVIVPEGCQFLVDPARPWPRARPGHRFALAATEVTAAQFWAFQKDHKVDLNLVKTPDCPVHNVSWYQAAAYCNWLSRQEGIPDNQWCYASDKNGRLEMVRDYLLRSGYRLPTEEEWEFACRAGARTLWSFGEADAELASCYARWSGNSIMDGERRPFPVGSLKPNDWGLFDMHGNMCEWCQEVAGRRPNDPMIFGNDIDCMVRGGWCTSAFRDVAADKGTPLGRLQTVTWAGFRPARTFP